MRQFLQSFGIFLFVPFFVGIAAFFISVYHFGKMLANKDASYEKTINALGPLSFFFSIYWNKVGLRHRRKFFLYQALFLFCLCVVIASGAFNSQ